MSSTVSSTQIQTISKKVLLAKNGEKRLVRTSSLEKIRRFNSFICSQQYYVLPALLAWLRSSQSGLQASTEKTIFFFRALLFSHFLYKIYNIEYKTILRNVAILVQIQYVRISQSHNLLRLAVFATGTVLSLELALCFYLLITTYVPSGLIFLISCFFSIIYLNFRSVYFKKKTDSLLRKKRI